MPGTRTAPQIDVAQPSYKRVSLNFVDVTSDGKANAMIADSAATLTQMEGLATETQERSNASLWEIEVTSVWSGIRSSANALNAPYVPITTNMRYSIKNSPTSRQSAYIPSVLISQLIANTDNPDLTALNDWFAAVLAVAGGTWVGNNVALVGHKERNQATKF